MTQMPDPSAFSRVSATIDIDAPGKAFGHLAVPYSSDASAWGSVRMPICVIKGGDGPTVLFTGGNHGDEYEGPIALMRMAQQLQPEELQGRAIILPTLNHAAVQAGKRVSPIDGRNMNRIFPGRWDGSVSEVVADYVFNHLVGRADVVCDLHSGGKTLDFVPSVAMHALPDPEMRRKTKEAITAFGAPVALVLIEMDNKGMLDTAVEDAGKVFVTTELGGGGTTRPWSNAVAQRGVTNLLCHFGLLDPGWAQAPEQPTRFLHTPEQGAFTVSRHQGIVEVLAEIGSEVQAGQPLCRVHNFEDIDAAPVDYPAPIGGMLYCRHYPGLVQRGDCLAVIAQDGEPD
jgi:N-alpha-acetyl-L-2,4-diaminobutyrate deacetylase